MCQPMEAAVHLSAFVAWFNQTSPYLPRPVRNLIAAEARNRLIERMRSGYGEAPLLFDDLARRGEDALAGLVR
jgi:hypothetical protein